MIPRGAGRSAGMTLLMPTVRLRALRPWVTGALCVTAGALLTLAAHRPQETSVYLAPTSCLTALTLADRGFSLAEEKANAASLGHGADVNDLAAQLDALAPRYLSAKTACRSSR
jgi:hypothetical protein